MPEVLDRNYFVIKAENARRRAADSKDGEIHDALAALAESYGRLAEESARNIALRDKLCVLGDAPEVMG